MYTVSILDKSKKIIRTYKHINKITYSDYIDDVTVSEEEMLSHRFPLDCTLRLYSSVGNYVISSDIIGTLEIEKEI